MRNVEFSFVMPAYKTKYLTKAIESILNQEYKDFELIIINDASPENIEEVVSQFHDSRIRYERNEKNIGGHDLVGNWNHCIAFANYDYLILATDDDVFEPNYLSEAAKMVYRYPDVNLIRAGVKRIDEKEQILDIEFPTKEYLSSREFMLYYAKGGFISCISNYIFKKEILLSKGGFISFPHAHMSDDATALLLSDNGVACIPQNLFNFRTSEINLSNKDDYKLAIEQIYASKLFVGWCLRHIEKLNLYPNDFFEPACFGGIKNRYVEMIEKLLDKIPFCKMFLVFKTIYLEKYLFKKEKIKVIINYLVNKL